MNKKKSSSQWIGQIPCDWAEYRFKDVTSLYTGNSIKDSDKDRYDDPNEAIPYISSKDIDVIYSTANYDNGMYVKKSDISFRRAKLGSTLMCIEGGSAGRKKTFLSQEVAFVNKLCCFEGNEKIDDKYLYYFLSNPAYEDEFKNNITGLIGGVSISRLKNIKICVPPLEKQMAIVHHLDIKCSEIDALIADIQAQIDTLEQYKRSVITEAVTKGLNPNVETKNSGNEWFGKIPRDWKPIKVLYVLKQPITDGPHTTPELYDEGIPFVSAEAVSCGNGEIDFNHIRGYISQKFYEECCKKYKPEKYDIYMIKSGATTGKVSIVTTDEIFTIWSPLAVFRCDKTKILPYFLFYSLQSTPFQNQVQDGWTYGTQQNIGMRTLEHLKVCLPSLEEQKEIVEFLNCKCKEIDEVVTKLKSQLTTLIEYKKSLIYEYVTGKKEVPTNA